MIYYNDFDQKCCALLRYQVEQGSLPFGYVDERSITDVKAEEIKQYRQVHLFAGIGAFPLGFKLAGLPDDLFIYTGGFPCQDLSVAGQRKGLAGSRSGLWFEFHRLIASNRPDWVIIENVPGLLSSNAGRDFAIVIGGLTGIVPTVPKGGWGNAGVAKGPIYTVAYRVLDSQFYGVPQRRRRVFIVASLRKFAPQEVLFERESSPWDTPPSREAGPGVAQAAIRRAQTSSNGWGIKEDGSTVPVDPSGGDAVLVAHSVRPRSGMPQGWNSNLLAFGGNNTSGEIDMSCALNAHGSRRYDFESETFIAATLNSGGNGGGFRTEPGEHLVFDWQSGGDVRLNISEYHTSALQSNQVPAVAIVAPTLSAESYSPSKSSSGQQVDYCRYNNPLAGVRRLTPLECERLQGFPDGHTDIGQSDSARYRQLGNAVTVPVSRWIAERIVKVHYAE